MGTRQAKLTCIQNIQQIWKLGNRCTKHAQGGYFRISFNSKFVLEKNMCQHIKSQGINV